MNKNELLKRATEILDDVSGYLDMFEDERECQMQNDIADFMHDVQNCFDDELYIVVEWVMCGNTSNFKRVVYGNTSLDFCKKYVKTKRELDFVNTTMYYTIQKASWDMVGEDYGKEVL